jgi:hypothetical protein
MNIGLRKGLVLAGSYAMFGKRPFSAHRCRQPLLKRDGILRTQNASRKLVSAGFWECQHNDKNGRYNSDISPKAQFIPNAKRNRKQLAPNVAHAVMRVPFCSVERDNDNPNRAMPITFIAAVTSNSSKNHLSNQLSI